jgi:putative spermidine/putrescine transport system permease protein
MVVPYLQLAPAVLLTASLAYGLLYMVWISLHSYNAFLAQQGPMSLAEYRRLFSSTNTSYMQILIRTIVISAIATGLAALLALPTAHAIVRTNKRALRSLAIFLLLVPFLMGESVRTFAWLLLLGSNGVVPYVIHALGGGSPTLLGETWTIVLGLLQVYVPLATLILIPGMRKVPADLERAAGSLGARPGQVWRKVVIPLVRPSLAAASTVVFALCMTEYAIPSALGLGAVPFVANSVSSIFFSEGNIYFGAAFSIVLIVVVLIAVALLNVGLAVPSRLRQMVRSRARAR